MLAFANKIGKPTPYASTPPQTNVVFKQTTPTNYIALMETKEKEKPLFKQLYESGNIYSEEVEDLATSKPKPNPFSLGKDPINTFYIGSVTVVGLLILYKILTK